MTSNEAPLEAVGWEKGLKAATSLLPHGHRALPLHGGPSFLAIEAAQGNSDKKTFQRHPQCLELGNFEQNKKPNSTGLEPKL